MKNVLLIFVLFLVVACEKDHTPLEPTTTGSIRIVLESKGGSRKSIPDSSRGSEKPAKPAALSQLEVRILKIDNAVLTSKTFTPSEGVFNVSIEVEAENNLKVLCLGTINGVVEYCGVDEDVDVQAGTTTSAVIAGWTDPFIPDITGITPNPSTDGTYTVSWEHSVNATTYVLQEADNQQFSGAVASYSTTSLQINISGKSTGTYYYRVQADNEYDIKSGWSIIESAVVQNTLTISGTVSGADGVIVTLDGDASDTQTVNDGDTYSFTVAEGGMYTITPAKNGYSFTPENQTFNNVASSQTRDFSCAQDFYTIYGTISGADGVLVILGGDTSDSQTVNDGGTYSFNVGGGGNYTVTPYKSGYLFDPTSRSFTEIIADHVQNFTGTSSAVTYTISGIVSGADGVTITLGGDASGSQIVNDGDSYSFTVAEDGNYTVTPTKSGYTFTPPSGTFNNVTSDQSQNFVAAVITYTISGTISSADGVTVTLSGDTTGTLVVDDGGTYSFTVAEGGNYTVTPTKSGYMFTPISKTFNNVTSQQTQDFEANLVTYTISGTISGADGVTVTLSGDTTGTLVVDDGGSYSFTVHNGGNYTVTPTKSGYTFSPVSQTFNNVTSDQTQDFTASQVIDPTEIEITMVTIPAGSFEMGDIQGGGQSDEQPVHTVTLDSFEMSVYEVTQEQYYATIGSNPSQFIGSDRPVETVNWYDAVKFCNRLSDEAGIERCYNESTWECDFTKNGFRLPTEAEWEYACRAGTETKYYTGDSESDLARAGWYNGNSESTHIVGQKEANLWGLYDMHGNVYEWCHDWYGSYSSDEAHNPTGAQNGSSRVLRGGGFVDGAYSCRSAFRHGYSPDIGAAFLGFRVVRGTFPPESTTYTISGTVTGADGVTVTLSGDATDTQTVDDGGSYSFTVDEGGNYTVIPTKSGYSFTPASQTFDNVTSNQDQNFTAEVIIPAGGRIAFMSDRDGNLEIYVMDVDGSNQRNLTNNPAEDHYPSLSPDGSRIAFASYRDGNAEIYVMGTDGSNPQNLTNNTALDLSPSLSPDGTRITFQSYRDGNWEIYVMDADGSNQRNLTNNTVFDSAPSWSPDDGRIAFMSYRDGNWEIYVMDADGSNQRNLTNNPVYNDYPSWSPDGAQITFTSDRDGNYEIYVMDADGSNQRRLTNNTAMDAWPSWSPF